MYWQSLDLNKNSFFAVKLYFHLLIFGTKTARKKNILKSKNQNLFEKKQMERFSDFHIVEVQSVNHSRQRINLGFGS